MNIYLRFFIVLYKSFFAKKINVMDSLRIPFHVLPTDCDLNFHMTNSRYFSFMDLGRIYFMGSLKLFSEMRKQGWAPVLGATEITFIRPLKPWRRFDVVTRILTWDEKYTYYEQRFEVEGELAALALSKGTFIKKGETVSLPVIMETCGVTLPPKPQIEAIDHWQALTAAKKTLNQKNPMF